MIMMNVTGRLAYDAKTVETRSGVPMASARIACRDTDDGVLWLDLVAFRGNAEWLSSRVKGDPVAAMGNVRIRTWEKDGETREQMELIADSLMVPGKRPSRKKTKPAAAADPLAGGEEAADVLPF